MRKILFYNWIPFDEKEAKGGGVTIYTRNLIRHFIMSSDWQVYFLSSGRTFDLFSKSPRIQHTENEYGNVCQSYEIVNSPVFSSARISFSFPDKILNDDRLLLLLKRFINEQGGFDVVHYQNFEGLSSSVFRLKEFFPNTKFIYSLHNYYLFCPQVMLWRNDRENCALTNCGAECFECMPKDVYSYKVRLNQYIAHMSPDSQGTIRKRLLILLQKRVADIADRYTKSRKFSEKQIEQFGRLFSKIKEQNVKNLNSNIDSVLAVSERVREIAIRKGVDPQKVSVNYIGTEVARTQADRQRNEYAGDVLNICYLGYMRTMKGFYFLLDALEAMPSEMSLRIGLVIAAPKTDVDAYERLMKLEMRFDSLTYFDGYSHDQLDEILATAHLGIVPPLWEDNLPQVAIEMKAKGVAVLASDLGGAKELSRAKEFVFEAGNKHDFYCKIKNILNNPYYFDLYWEKQMKLITMEEHIKQLEQIYMGI